MAVQRLHHLLVESCHCFSNILPRLSSAYKKPVLLEPTVPFTTFDVPSPTPTRLIGTKSRQTAGNFFSVCRIFVAIRSVSVG